MLELDAVLQAEGREPRRRGAVGVQFADDPERECRVLRPELRDGVKEHG